MSTNRIPKTRVTSPTCNRRTRWGFTIALAFLCFGTVCHGQGTMTFTFNGESPGTYSTTSGYIESGMTFWNPYSPGSLVLMGPGVSGTPQDGTAYLQVPPGCDLAFSFTPETLFNLNSFDAAGYDTSSPGASLEVVGYHVMGGMVTNYITVDSFLNREANNLPDFETFYLSSQFQNVYRVDILTANWSLDNVVISGIPEPPTGALVVAGALCGIGYARVRRGGGAGGCEGVSEVRLGLGLGLRGGG